MKITRAMRRWQITWSGLRAQLGFIEMQSVRDPDGTGITVCYWESEAAIAGWKRDVDHAAAQQRGKDAWYLDYRVTIARVERSYGRSR
jgi:heme-degrading monooxygenase HmoA